MLLTLENSQIENLNNIISGWHGKIILKTNVTKVKLNQSGNICSIEDETSYKPESQEVSTLAKPFHIYSPEINKNRFTYKTHKSKEESEEISGLWLDPQGDFMITSPHPLKTEIIDEPYAGASKTHLIHSPGMLIFRHERIDLKEIDRKFAEFMRT
jgi:hypothetical protein